MPIDGHRRDFQTPGNLQGRHAVFVLFQNLKCLLPDVVLGRQDRPLSCFVGADDDGDEIADVWGIPHWVAYELKKFDGG